MQPKQSPPVSPKTPIPPRCQPTSTPVGSGYVTRDNLDDFFATNQPKPQPQQRRPSISAPQYHHAAPSDIGLRLPDQQDCCSTHTGHLDQIMSRGRRVNCPCNLTTKQRNMLTSSDR